MEEEEEMKVCFQTGESQTKTTSVHMTTHQYVLTTSCQAPDVSYISHNATLA